jgi:tetratricopeptide (TPR) repeat protein
MAHLDAEALAALLEGQSFQILQHFLTCARCRHRLSSVLFDIGMPADEGSEAWQLTAPSLGAHRGPIGGIRDELAAPLASRFASAKAGKSTTLETILDNAFERLAAEQHHSGDSPEAKLLVEALLKLPPEVRIEAVEAQNRYRTPEMVDILLAEARNSSLDPPAARHLAGLAGAILGHNNGTARRQRVESLISCILADAERRMGRLDLSEDILVDAADSLRDQPLILEERVVLCRSLSALRQEQGRVDEALGLLDHATTLAEELGNFHELGLVRLAYGWLLLEEYEPERAILPLREALALLDPVPTGNFPEETDQTSDDPYPAFSALHALTLAYADLGDDEFLQGTLTALEQLAPQLPDPLDRVRIRWIRARAEARRDQFEVAFSVLGEVFDSLLTLGPGEEAALAALDLARWTAEQSIRDSAFQARFDEIAQKLFALPSSRLAPHLRIVLRFALDFPKRGAGAFLDVLIGAASYIERARFNSDYPFHPTPEPERVILWSDLNRHHRRQAAASAGVDLDRNGYPRNSDDHLLIAWTHEALTGQRIQLPLSLDDETRD